jgi:glycosyltransferase involved in cell wall biosynthesis
VTSIFSKSDIVVAPYREASQSGVAALALATGTPLVATTVGAMPDMLRHEENCLLVPPNDPLALAAALQRLLDDRPLRERIRAGQLHTAKHSLSWTVLAEQYVTIYARVRKP